MAGSNREQVELWRIVLKSSRICALQAILLALLIPAFGSADMAMKKTEKVLVDFAAVDEQDRWLVVNDGVMGGLSQGLFAIETDGSALFHGRLSLENNGGFSSVRRASREYDLASYIGVIFRVRGDGRTYQFRLRMSDRFDAIAFRAEFETRADTWTTVSIPFAAFEATFRGRRVPGAPELRPDRIVQIGFLIADQHAGPFRLSIDWIRAYASGSAASEE